MPTLVYTPEWSDAGSVVRRTRILADSREDAEAVTAELTAISLCAWTGMREDGLPYTPAHQDFGGTPDAASTHRQKVRLWWLDTSGRGRHQVTVPSPKPSYVTLETRRSTTDPLSDPSKVKTVQGEAFGVFQSGDYIEGR